MDPDLLGNLLDQHAAVLELFARQWCDVPEDGGPEDARDAEHPRWRRR